MGCGPSWAADQAEAEERRRFADKYDEIFATLGAVAITKEIQRLLKSLERTPQTEETFSSIGHLKKMLDL